MNRAKAPDKLAAIARLEVSYEMHIRIDELANSVSVDFRELTVMAGLDPRLDFKGADLRGIDFGSCDLSGFDFSGANLSGCNLNEAKTIGAVFAGAVFDFQETVSLDEAQFSEERNAGVSEASSTFPVTESERERLGKMLRFADQGDMFFQYEVGTRFAGGYGVRKSIKIARHYFSLSAKQGHMKARRRLDKLS